MATLYYAPCIVVGLTRYYLPPWVKIEYTRAQTVEAISVVETDEMVITSVRPNQGTRITLSASGIRGDINQAEVNAWYAEIWAAVMGETFDFFIWSDHCWHGCAVPSMGHGHDVWPYVVAEAKLEILCPSTTEDFTEHLSFTDFDTEYPYAAVVGRPVADELVSNPRPVNPVMQPLGGIFTGVIDAVTVAGEEHKYVVGGNVGSQWRLEGAYIAFAENAGATGTTTIRFSTVGVGGVGGSFINVTVLSGAMHSAAEVSASITFTAGDILYVYVTGANLHQNLQYRFRLRAL